MKVPSKGTTITVRGYGTGLFVKGPNMDNETPTICMKFEGGASGDEIVTIPWSEFQEKRVYPGQQPSTDTGHNWDALMNEELEKFKNDSSEES